MRLLNATTMHLLEFSDIDSPRYAILSHTWGRDEVMFSDIEAEHRFEKRGYPKIKGACEQARQDGFEWIWIDSCCIDKSSSADLSEAINSMFRLYEHAEVCYAYLEDVRDLYESAGEADFEHTRWFTRGWTLQEFIAPRKLDFFDKAWNYIASRSAIADQLARITGIDATVQRGEALLGSYTVAQRLSWASFRRTTRVEDAAYSLLGIFGVNMPLLYGESKKALQRLQEEIIRNSADLSIFAWSYSPGTLASSYRGPLATSLADFSRCTSVVSVKQSSGAAWPSETTSTNVGLRITASVVEVSGGASSANGLAMILNCRYADDVTTVLGLRLTPLSQVSATEALQHEVLRCAVGWTSDSGQERLAKVDVLQAAQKSRLKTIMLERDGRSFWSDPQALSGCPRDWTHIWLRMTDPGQKEAWDIVDLYPKQYWYHPTWTFDLAKARTDRMRREGESQNRNPGSTFGLPIHGGIALQDKRGCRVAVFFCQRNASLQDGITYDVGPYALKMFQDPEQRMLDRNVGTAHQLQLEDGRTFEVALKVDKISELVIAHLAATVSAVEPQSRDHGVLHGPSRRRNPLQLIRKHRDGSIR